MNADKTKSGILSALACLAIFVLNVWLGWPLFHSGELPFRGSIEGGYAGMARFVAAHPNPWGWDPLPYGGLPTQFLYVPAVPYFAAIWIRVFSGAQPEFVYRIVVALATCLGPVTLFWFALRFTGERKWAFAAAVAYSLFSPSYGLFPAVEKDRGIVQLPWRLQVLAKYGEGPHCTGLTLLPLALLAVWRAARERRFGSLFGAAALLAAIPLTNWLSGFALAISAGLLLVATWRDKDFRIARAFGAAGLAYLLACFWLTPTFVRTIAFNWPTDSFGYHFGHAQQLLVAGIAVGIVVVRVLWRGSVYFCFVVMGTLVFGAIATAYYVYGVDVIPESRRYALEFEFFLMLAIVETLRLTLRSANSTVRLCAIGSAGAMLLAGMPQVFAYLKQGPESWAPAPRESTVEYQAGKWIAGRFPEGRVFATGGLRFRLNSWFDLQQVGGGFETGLQNRVPVDLAYRVRSGEKLRPGREVEDTRMYLEALGAEYAVVHGKGSREYYRDFVRPERLAGLPVVWHSEDDSIYRLPGRGLAHVVREDEIVRDDPKERSEVLERYVAGRRDESRPYVAVRWIDPAYVTIDAPAGSLVSMQVNADPGWSATGAGIERDALGFMVLRTTGSGPIQLQYRGTAEQRMFAALSVLAWLASIALWWRARGRATG
jgi:hypothetical protein